MLGILFLGVLIVAPTAHAQANPHTDPLNLDPQVRQAYDHFYNLDYNGAETIFNSVLAQHRNDPMAYNYLLLVTIFHELYSQDLLDTTYYAHDSFLFTKRYVPVSQGVRNRIEELTKTVIGLCDQRINANPQDKNAYFARSYGRGMHAAFILLVDHAYAHAAHEGLQSRADSEAAIKLDPQYYDADMSIGIQQFSVASLPRFLRFMIGVMGTTGSKQKGLDLLKLSAQYGVVTSVESRTALSLFLRHDGRYNDALAVERSLIAQYPRDFLFRLEEANILKDEGTGPTAMAAYERVIDDATKKHEFVDPRLQLAWFGLADTQRGWGMLPQAAQGYVAAATEPNCTDWLRKRAWLNAGETYDLLHDRNDAVKAYQKALAAGGDQSQADAARRYLATPYSGK
jgi:hypothetical protein